MDAREEALEMVITKSVSDILNTKYGQYDISCEPSKFDIETALATSTLESRGFQQHYQELNEEWNASATSVQEYCDRVRQYHARRIAHFVRHGWTDPIALNSNGRTIKDGLHRFKAAIHMGRNEVEVTIEGLA